MAKDREYRVPLPGGGTFSFTGPFPLSAGDWAYVLSVMEVMKPGLIEEPGTQLEDR